MRRICPLFLVLALWVPFSVALLAAFPSPAHGAESQAQRRANLRDTQIRQRDSYDQCLEKAASLADAEKSEAQRQCRRSYALQRLSKPEVLWNAFDQKTMEAQEEFSERLIGIQGTVHKASMSSLGFPEIVFALDAFGVRSVRCQFPKSAAEKVLALKPGQEVTLGGICKGFANDNVVRLINCEML